MRSSALAFGVVVSLVSIPAAAFTQATFAGTVKDWQTATFVRSGLVRVARDGVELMGSRTVQVDVDMATSPVTETVDVRAEDATIDACSARHEITLSGDAIRSIPTVRSYNALLPLVPGVVTNINDTVIGTASASFPIHGGRTNEGRLLLDGLTIGSPPGGNSATNDVVDLGFAGQVNLSANGLGEADTAGLNSSAVLTYGGTFVPGGVWPQPIGIVTPRVVELTGEILF